MDAVFPERPRTPGRMTQPGHADGEENFSELGRAPPTRRATPSARRASADREDQAVEAALRPKDLDEFIGQEKVREQLDLVLRAARAAPPPTTCLLSGAPGLGKTTLSMIIAAEMGAPIRITSGPAIQHAGDLAAILSSLQEGEVLFLDEIHRMSRPAEEMLYMAMEDFRVDVIVGKGPSATAIPLELPPFTLVGATTRAGLLPPPLRDRFGFTAHMEFYEPAELQRVIHRSAHLLDVEIGSGRRRRDRGALPRHAPYRQPSAAPRPGLRAGQGGRDHHPRIAAAALKVYEVDARGLDRLDRGVLEALLASSSAAARSVCPRSRSRWGRSARPLRRSGPSPSSYGRDCSARTPRGRVATPAAWAHLGLTPPRRPMGGNGRGTCSGRDGARTRGQEPRCHAERCSLSADSLEFRRRCRPSRRHTYPHPAGRSPSRSKKEVPTRHSRDPPPVHRAHRGHVPDDPVGRQQQAASMRNEMQPSSGVRTIGGMYATVKEVNEDSVLLDAGSGRRPAVCEERDRRRALRRGVQPHRPRRRARPGRGRVGRPRRRLLPRPRPTSPPPTPLPTPPTTSPSTSARRTWPPSRPTARRGEGRRGRRSGAEEDRRRGRREVGARPGTRRDPLALRTSGTCVFARNPDTMSWPPPR